MIRIYGASDDLVEIEGALKEEVTPHRTITIGDDKRGVLVTMRYSAKGNGCWRASVDMVGEGVPMFPVTITQAEPHGGSYDGGKLVKNPYYSVMVNVDCPPGTQVTRGKRLLGITS